MWQIHRKSKKGRETEWKEDTNRDKRKGEGRERKLGKYKERKGGAQWAGSTLAALWGELS